MHLVARGSFDMNPSGCAVHDEAGGSTNREVVFIRLYGWTRGASGTREKHCADQQGEEQENPVAIQSWAYSMNPGFRPVLACAVFVRRTNS
jgi:hypothetical protein